MYFYKLLKIILRVALLYYLILLSFILHKVLTSSWTFKDSSPFSAVIGTLLCKTVISIKKKFLSFSSATVNKSYKCRCTLYFFMLLINTPPPIRLALRLALSLLLDTALFCSFALSCLLLRFIASILSPNKFSTSAQFYYTRYSLYYTRCIHSSVVCHPVVVTSICHSTTIRLNTWPKFVFIIIIYFSLLCCPAIF